MKGVPVRLEVGPRDIENNQAVLARRDTGEKKVVSLDNLEAEIADMLEDIQHNLFIKARDRRDAKHILLQIWKHLKKSLSLIHIFQS